MKIIDLCLFIFHPAGVMREITFRFMISLISVAVYVIEVLRKELKILRFKINNFDSQMEG